MDISISDFWVRDMVFSLQTKKAIFMLKYLGESGLMPAIYFKFLVW